MKKLKLLIVTSLVLCFSGCFIKEKDVTQIAFPITLMISKNENKYRLHMLILSNSMSSKIELESGLHDTLYHTIIFEGDTMSEASQKIGVVTNGSVSAIKIRSIILHKSLFEKTTIDYQDISNYIINNPLYRTNIYLYYTEDEPDEILNINSLNFSTNTHFYLSRPDRQHLNDFLLPSKLLDTTKSFLDNRRMFYLPSLSMSKEHLKQESDGELKPVNTYKIDGGFFLTNQNEFKYVSVDNLQGLKWKNNLKYFDIELGQEENLLNVKIENTKWKTKIIDGNIYVEVNVLSKINYNHTDLKASEVEEKLKQHIENDIIGTYKSNYKEIDIYHFNDLSYRLKKDINNLDTFKLNVKTTIKNTIYEY